MLVDDAVQKRVGLSAGGGRLVTILDCRVGDESPGIGLGVRELRADLSSSGHMPSCTRSNAPSSPGAARESGRSGPASAETSRGRDSLAAALIGPKASSTV